MSKNQPLSELLHYNPSVKKYASLKKGLEEYQFLLTASATAATHFQKGEFDSLVGENACQIRAIKIALIASHQNHEPDRLSRTIAKALESMNELLSASVLNTYIHEGRSLRDLIHLHELDVLLTSEEVFLIQSYLLTEMKETQTDPEYMGSILRKERYSPRILQEKYPQMTNSFLGKMAMHLKKGLSRSSVAFVRNTAAHLQDPDLMKMTAEEFELEHNKLACLPSYWSFKVLFSLAQKEQIPLILHAKFLRESEDRFRIVDKEFLYFKPCPKSCSYVATKPTGEDWKRPACIVQGILCPQEGEMPSKQEWREFIAKTSVMGSIDGCWCQSPAIPRPRSENPYSS